MSIDTLSVVGAVGGAGTTRMTIELAGTLAWAGRDVAVLDAAFATQGLARYHEGRIDPDLTSVLTDEATLDDVTLPVGVSGSGSVNLAPTRAPVERYARAMTADAAEAFERQIGGAALTHDIVLIDTPPIAGNQAIAAVTTTDRVAVVTPDSPRGRDGLALMSERLTDLGVSRDAVLATFADESESVLPEASARIPPSPVADPSKCPTAVSTDSPIAPAVAAAVEATLETDLGIDFDTSPGLGDVIGELSWRGH